MRMCSFGTGVAPSDFVGAARLGAVPARQAQVDSGKQANNYTRLYVPVLSKAPFVVKALCASCYSAAGFTRGQLKQRRRSPLGVALLFFVVTRARDGQVQSDSTTSIQHADTDWMLLPTG